MSVDSAPDFHQSASSKKFDGLRPDHISPSTLLRTLLQFGCERSSHRAISYLIDAGYGVLLSVPPIRWIVDGWSATRKLWQKSRWVLVNAVTGCAVKALVHSG